MMSLWIVQYRNWTFLDPAIFEYRVAVIDLIYEIASGCAFAGGELLLPLDLVVKVRSDFVEPRNQPVVST